MYIFIENNNRENGKKRKKEKKKSWVGPDASTPNHYTRGWLRNLGEKSLISCLFHKTSAGKMIEPHQPSY